MKNYRVDFPREDTGRRAHRDFSTLEGALRFMKYIGSEYCVLKKYDKLTACFEAVDDELIEVMNKLIF